MELPAGTLADLQSAGVDAATDQRYETRMAWIASLWAAMAVLASVVAIWDSWHVSP